MKIKIILFVLAALLLSCKAQKDIAYMQNIEQVAQEAYTKNVQSTIQPNDQLLIYVAAKDMMVAAPFNQSVSTDGNSSRVAYSQSSTNMPTGNQTSLSGVSYTVYPEGYIDFPIIGKVETQGKTLEELKVELTQKIKKYIYNPTVSVRYGNFKISVLGEVNRPGDYIVPDGRATLLSALAMAGDLNLYGRRDNVLIIREQDGVRTQTYINLKDANFINSPYYHIKQNDVIYVTPNETKKQSAAYGPQTGIYISAASVILGLLTLIVR